MVWCSYLSYTAYPNVFYPLASNGRLRELLH